MVVWFSLRHCVNHLVFSREALNPLLLTPPHSISTARIHLRRRNRRIDSPHPHILRKPRLSSCPAAAAAHRTSAVVLPPFSSGVEEKDVLMGFIMGRSKATELAHSVWKKVVRKGDVVVDATCGNGQDTLVLLKLVADESNKGLVYGMDIQNSALEITSSLLDESVSANERQIVKLFHLCHSKMEDVILKNTSVRVITLNLGYLPGGDKDIITLPKTTLLALQAAARILAQGGLISVVVYVGHPGGREELETVKSFASSLPADSWVSCKFEVLNRSNAPMLALFFKK